MAVVVNEETAESWFAERDGAGVAFEYRQMTMLLQWTALLLGVLAVAPVAAEAALRLYASYVTRPARLFCSDAQMGWSNAPNLLTTRINAAGEEWSIRN
jgi:hypothetical protein